MARELLVEAQKNLGVDQLNSFLIETEKRMFKDLEEWSLIEENIWHQKSRVDWIKLGDANTKLFHSYVKTR